MSSGKDPRKVKEAWHDPVTTGLSDGSHSIQGLKVALLMNFLPASSLYLRPPLSCEALTVFLVYLCLQPALFYSVIHSLDPPAVPFGFQGQSMEKNVLSNFSYHGEPHLALAMQVVGANPQS